jgi:hypothetical protein
MRFATAGSTGPISTELSRAEATSFLGDAEECHTGGGYIQVRHRLVRGGHERRCECARARRGAKRRLCADRDRQVAGGIRTEESNERIGLIKPSTNLNSRSTLLLTNGTGEICSVLS